MAGLSRNRQTPQPVVVVPSGDQVSVQPEGDPGWAGCTHTRQPRQEWFRTTRKWARC